MARLLVWTLISLALCSRADRFAENVADFALQSLNRLFTTDHLLLLDHLSATVPNNGFYNLQGALRNPTLSGLNSITNITTHVGSVTGNSLRYSFVITSPVISGDYEISGYVGSPVLPFEGIGDFQIMFAEQINILCGVIIKSVNGFLQFGDRCVVTASLQMRLDNAKLNFTGLVEHPLLDRKLILNILQDIVEHFILVAFQPSASIALQHFINAHLNLDFQSREFLDIILAHKPERLNYQQNRYHQKLLQDKKNESNAVIDDRLCSFIMETILSISQSMDPFPLGTIFNLENSRSALFPSGGILSDLKLSGLSTMSKLYCSSRIARVTEFYIEFEMPKVTLSGTYNITGSVAGEIPVSSTGKFTIVSENGARYLLQPWFLSVNGHFSYYGLGYAQFTILNNTYGTSFPGLLEGVDVDPQVAKAVVNSIGESVFCPPLSWCSFVNHPLRDLVMEHLQQRFLDVPIVDIITI